MVTDEGNVAFFGMPVLVEHGGTTQAFIVKYGTTQFQPLFPVAFFEQTFKLRAGNDFRFYIGRLDHG